MAPHLKPSKKVPSKDFSVATGIFICANTEEQTTQRIKMPRAFKYLIMEIKKIRITYRYPSMLLSLNHY